MSDLPLIAIIVLLATASAYGLAKAMRLSPTDLIVGTAGTVVGVLIGALLSIPLSKLPDGYGNILPIAITLLSTLVMVRLFVSQRGVVAGLFINLRPGHHPRRPEKESAHAQHSILVDTSVIIDGRIADIAQTGFVPGKLVVPRFVLAELQNIADSDDSLRRGRGRRGLEMLKTIQSTEGVQLEISDEDAPEIKEVDAKLVALAKRNGADIMTTDYNLNGVAQIEGVRVLNINELSNAIRPVVLPGEEMSVKIVQSGKERNQGVGYLPDGTMIVVENGDKLIGQEISVEVARVFQTVAGKMIFATPVKAAPSANGKSRRGRGRQSDAEPRRVNDNRRSQRPDDIESRLVQGNQSDPSHKQA